jgi:hypothetical protein
MQVSATTQQFVLVVRKTAKDWSSLVVVLAGTLAAMAALLDLALWVSIGAAVAAVLAGVRVLRDELVMPVRLEAVERATAQLLASTNGHSWAIGSAVHLGQRRWVTAGHSVVLGQGATLRTSEGVIKGVVIYRSEDSNLAVILAEREWPWRAQATGRVLDRGEAIRAVDGCTGFA